MTLQRANISHVAHDQATFSTDCAALNNSSTETFWDDWGKYNGRSIETNTYVAEGAVDPLLCKSITAVNALSQGTQWCQCTTVSDRTYPVGQRDGPNTTVFDAFETSSLGSCSDFSKDSTLNTYIYSPPMPSGFEGWNIYSYNFSCTIGN